MRLCPFYGVSTNQIAPLLPNSYISIRAFELDDSYLAVFILYFIIYVSDTMYGNVKCAVAFKAYFKLSLISSIHDSGT